MSTPTRIQYLAVEAVDRLRGQQPSNRSRRCRQTWHILVAAVAIAAGCASSEPETAALQTLQIELATIAESDTGDVLGLVFVNRSDLDLIVEDVQVRNKGTGLIDSVITGRSRTRIGARRREQIVLKLSPGAGSRLDANTVYAVRSIGGEALLQASGYAHAPRLAAIRCASDLSELYVYAWMGGDALDDPGTECVLNGRRIKWNGRSELPAVGDNAITVLRFQRPHTLESGDTVAFTICRKDALLCGGVARLVPDVFFGATQYDYPLRITRVSWEDESVQLALYNESTHEKPRAVVESVTVDGVDVTAACGLPASPLVADRHRYAEDERLLTIPKSHPGSGMMNVTIEYRLLPPNGTVIEDSRRLNAALREGVPFAIGAPGSPTMPGCVALSNWGLRPKPDPIKVRRDAATVHSAAPGLPTYVQLAAGARFEDVIALSEESDFVITAALTGTKMSGRDAVREVLDQCSQCRDAGIPFIYSATANYGDITSPEERQWLAMIALSRGSRGMLLSAPQPGSRRVGWNDLFQASGDRTEAGEQLEQLISPSVPIELPMRVTQPGIDLAALACGVDHVLVFVTNLWCNRTIPPISSPDEFMAAPRHNVDIHVDLGKDWLGNVTDLGTGGLMPFSNVHGTATWEVQLPPFQIGRVLLLHRNNGVTSTPIPDGVAAFRDEVQVPPLIQPVSSPFMRMGVVENSCEQAIRLPLENLTETEIRIDVVLERSEGNSRAELTFEQLAIPGMSTSELRGVLVVPENGQTFVVKGAILANGEAVAPFYVAGKTAPLVTASPSIVDFGLIDGDVQRTIAIIPADPDLIRITDVVVSVSGDVAAQAGPAPLQFIVKPRAGVEQGEIAGAVNFSVSIEGHATRELRVPIVGYRSSDLIVRPTQLTVRDGGNVSIRSIILRRSDGAPFSVTQISCPAFGWKLQTGNSSADHRIDLTIPDEIDLAQAQAGIVIDCELDGDTRQIRLPVHVISSRQQVPDTRDAESSTRLMRVSNSVERLEAALLRREWPMWVQMHTLMLLGAGANKDGGRAKSQADFTLELLSSTRGGEEPGTFELRRGRPWPRSDGRRFEVEHHRDQLLQYLSIGRVPLTAPLRANGSVFTLRDLLERSLLESRESSAELSWTVAAYTAYLEPRQSWDNKFGEGLTLGHLVRGLVASGERSCWGTHRLLALSRVLRKTEQHDDPLIRALLPQIQALIAAEWRRLRETQQPGGAFRPPDPAPQPDGRWDHQTDRMVLWYTGHTLEWLSYALPPEDFQDRPILAAVDALEAALTRTVGTIDGLEIDPDSEDLFLVGFASHGAAGLARWKESIETDRN